MRLAEYETRLHDGERQIAFVEELQQEGFNVTYGMFRTLLWRARNRAIAKQSPITETPLVGESREIKTLPSGQPTKPRKINSPKDIEGILSGEIEIDD